ncbi:unnamed protein product [Paramecium pentaurelia]|uniref:Uncharacterized protein n=1 Tax=Paramecium pentaurelia TaxID=43138 RepID=A0A8S1S6T5_9CILI|nr:unnamed protein product [Paramecium pentaurelia]
MSLVKSFELALKQNDILSKVLPILKFINQTIPFPQKHSLIHEPRIIRFLLQLHSLIPDTIDMILMSLLNIFKHSKEWIDGCFKAIEEYAQLPNQGNGKYVALEFLETVLIEISELDFDVDDKCYAFIIFLQNAENEKLVRAIMKKVGQIQQQLGHRMKSANQLNQLIEETVLKLYQEEVQKNTNEFHYQNVAIELQEKGSQARKGSKPKMSLMAMNILQSQSLSSKMPSKQQLNNDHINNNNSDDSIQASEVNLDEILIQHKPRIDSEQSEYLADIDALQNLFAYITNPVATEPGLIFATDALANDIQQHCDDNQYKQHVMKPDKLTTLRSYKAMLFLTDYHNHQMIMQINSHTMQIAFRSISGFFQNSQSSGNLTHIIGLLQFYLKYELKETVYNFLYFQFHQQFLDYLYNPHYLDFLMRFMDPNYSKIPQDLRNYIWQFLNRQGYITLLVSKITNKEKEGIFNKRKDITKEAYQFLKHINDYKLQLIQDDDQAAITYSISSNIDQYLGPLIPGKTLIQNKQLLERKMLLSSHLRRGSDLSSLTRQINKVIIQENIDLSELNQQGKDIDRLQDVVQFYKEISTPAETPTLYNVYRQASEGMKNIQFEHRSQRSQATEPPLNIIQLQNSIRLPSLNIQPTCIITELTTSKNTQRKQKSMTFSENNPGQTISKRSDQPQYMSLVGTSDNISTYRQINLMQTPTSQAKLFVYYPNQDNSVVDTIMKEEYSKYETQNDEITSLRNSNLLKIIIQSMQNFEYHYAFDELLDDQYILFEKLLNHYSLTQTALFQSSYEENSSNNCQIILIDLIQRINKKPMNEKLSKLYVIYLPRICRNLTNMHKMQNEKISKEEFFSNQNHIGGIRIFSTKIIDLILRNFKQRNHRIYLKLNDTSSFNLNEQFHQLPNPFYQQIFYSIMKQLCLFAQEKQVQAILFKANLLEGISQAFHKNVVNKVIVRQGNVEAYLLHLALLSQLIILVYELRDDLQSYKTSLLRLQCFQNLKEVIEMFKNNKLIQLQALDIQKQLQKKK